MRGVEAAGSHELGLKNREELSVNGVRQVLNYDEREVQLETVLGPLLIKGEGLNITHLDIARGELQVKGTVVGLLYAAPKGKGVWQRLLK